jgi:hypothetical protein
MVPFLDSPAIQSSADDAACKINNKIPVQLKHVSPNRFNTTCRANNQFKTFQKQWVRFCKLSFAKAPQNCRQTRLVPQPNPPPRILPPLSALEIKKTFQRFPK